MVTVFTPVYNRKYILNNLYQSLLRQTNKNFEWIILDDGSTDHLEELVFPWLKEDNKFEIRFYQKNNGGKHRAINQGVQYARGDAFFVVDSDDYLVDNAIEYILRWWSEIDNRDNYAGVSGMRILKSGEIIGGEIGKKFIDATNLQRKEFSLLGDKAEIYKTSILKKYPFPEIDGENFITEAVVWDKIACDDYLIRWYDKPIYVCEYIEDGLTKAGIDIFEKNPKGWALYIKQHYLLGIKDVEQYIQACLSYYEINMWNISQTQIKEWLDIDDDLWGKVIACYQDNLKIVKQYLCFNKIKTISLYGFGYRGKRISSYLRKLNQEVEFVLDQRYKRIQALKAYPLEGNWPIVDIIIITVKENPEIIKTFINKKKMEQRVEVLENIVHLY